MPHIFFEHVAVFLYLTVNAGHVNMGCQDVMVIVVVFVEYLVELAG